MRKKAVVGLLCNLFTSLLGAQMPEDLSGKWVGSITQVTDKEKLVYYFEINLEKSDTIGKWQGNSFSFAKYKGGKRYLLRLQLEACTSHDTLYFKETNYIDYFNNTDNSAHSHYCYKRGWLRWTYQEDEKEKGYFSGTWEGIDPQSGLPCFPGPIVLKRYQARPEEIDTLTVIQNGKIAKAHDRPVKAGHKVFVQSNFLTLRVFDDGKEDGDVISLLYNNQWILKNYKLRNQPRVIKVQLEPHRLYNFLVCYANQMGKQPPVTTAIVISDGKKDKKVVLHSDLQNCDIIYFETE
ncbi:MAG: hypothetical protein RMJ44_11920 [Cytophagales bacterium]|nr:hypothetical protein [Bernardetiaceae bacterium]MDW8211782.1 hypothetical protein [Cytophagales bacterium]